MKSFFSQLLGAALNAGLQGGSIASNQQADLKTVGVTAGASAVAGILQFILTHPFTSHPTTTTVVAQVQALPVQLPLQK